MTIAIFDVDYRDTGARAAVLLADTWTSAAPSAGHSLDLTEVAAYEPGQFYKRELPCLLALLQRLPLPIGALQALVIDGHVWLDAQGRPGLGAHLHQAVGGALPVVGVGKTAFGPLTGTAAVAEVRRGTSQRPLYVSCVGMDLGQAAAQVTSMHGEHRVPTLLTAVDHLARSSAPADWGSAV